MTDEVRDNASQSWDGASILTAVTVVGMVAAMAGAWLVPEPAGERLAIAGLVAVYAAGGTPAGLSLIHI